MIVTVATTCIVWNHHYPSRQRDPGVAIYVSLAFIANKESPFHLASWSNRSFPQFSPSAFPKISVAVSSDFLRNGYNFLNVKTVYRFMFFTRTMALVLLLVLVLNSVAIQERKNKTIAHSFDLPLLASGYIVKRIFFTCVASDTIEKMMLEIFQEILMELLSVISHLSLESCHFSRQLSMQIKLASFCSEASIFFCLF